VEKWKRNDNRKVGEEKTDLHFNYFYIVIFILDYIWIVIIRKVKKVGKGDVQSETLAVSGSRWKFLDVAKRDT
jgi:hypothetical protein